MKKYFNYELKKNSYVIGVLALVMTILYVAPILLSDSPELKRGSNIGMLSVYVGIVAVIVPIWLMDYKMKKRSVDLYYALPLSHTKILVARFLLGLFAVLIPYTVSYWLGALVMIAKINNAISAIWYLPFYFASLIPIYIIYSISAFVYTRANNGVDGFMFLLFWCFALTLTAYALQILVSDSNEFSLPTYLLPFHPLIIVSSYFKDKICNDAYATPRLTYMIIGFVILALMSAGATFGLLWTERKSKAENVSQISESWFGYKTMLPLYTVFLTSICPLQGYLSILIIILIITAAFFTNVLYRRTIKIGKSQAIILGASFLVGITLSIINTCA